MGQEQIGWVHPWSIDPAINNLSARRRTLELSPASTDTLCQRPVGVQEDVSRNEYYCCDSIAWRFADSSCLVRMTTTGENPLHLLLRDTIFVRLLIWDGAQLVHDQKQVHFSLYLLITRTKGWVIGQEWGDDAPGDVTHMSSIHGRISRNVQEKDYPQDLRRTRGRGDSYR